MVNTIRKRRNVKNRIIEPSITRKRKMFGGITPIVKDYSNDPYRETANSWALHAMKSMLGIKSVRNKVLKHFYPMIKNLTKAETFDAFDPVEKIVKYVEGIMSVEHYVVFTATNMAELVAVPETHYQTFYVDNINKQVFAVDPARKNGKDGIYTPYVSNDLLRPLFEKHGYAFTFIEMTNPAQSSIRDVFCQSWSLYILLDILQKGVHKVKIPKQQLERYGVLLKFYKEILQIPKLAQTLKKEYVSELKANKDVILSDGTELDYKYLLGMDPALLIGQMKKKDME
jgi:hypothetical protein